MIGAQVVLDLDETLVCAYHRNKVPADLLHSRAKSFEVAYNLGDGRMGNVVVFPRPGVQAFLESIAAFAELVVFTAGHAGALVIFRWVSIATVANAVSQTVWLFYRSEGFPRSSHGVNYSDPSPCLCRVCGAGH